MPAAPQNPLTSTAKPVTKFMTWLGGPDGTAPTEENDDPTYQPMVIGRSAGGRSIDYCTFAVDLGKNNTRLVDMRTPAKWNRQIEVRQKSTEPPKLDDDGDPIDNSEPVFWGMLGTQTLYLTRRDEAATVTARMDHYLFGGPLTGMRVRDPRTNTIVLVESDPFFNPLVNGAIWDNRSTHQDPLGDSNGFYLWVHPESIKTTAAETYQGETSRAPWTLAGIVHTLCRMLNRDETYIKNPTRAELQASIVDRSPPVIANFWLRRGMYLPQYLDAVLEPHGFGWFVKVSRGVGGESVRKITVFKRGEGDEKEIFLQKIGEDLDVAKSNVEELTHELSVADLANKVYGYGGLQEREITLELYKGWLESEDSLTPDDLDKTATPDEGSVYLDHPNAHRLWVANEAGDWKNFRTEIGNPRDLSGVFDKFVARRRRIDDCIQTDVNGRRLPPMVEWTSDDTPDVWTFLPPGSYSVLSDQIGIRFNGSKPPDELAYRTGVKVRITGTVAGDSRLFKGADRRPESPNGKDVILFLDVSDRFFDRQIQTTGTYASATYNDTLYQPDERDDGDDLQDYVNEVRNVEDAANLRVSITLFGIQRDYEIGDLVTKVAGREISFNRLSDGVQEKRYLQIVGIDFDRPRQLTILRVTLNRDEGFELDGSFGGPIGKKLRLT